MLNAVGQNVFPKSIVCGVVPLFDDDSWKLVNISVCTYVGTIVHHLLKEVNFIWGGGKIHIRYMLGAKHRFGQSIDYTAKCRSAAIHRYLFNPRTAHSIHRLHGAKGASMIYDLIAQTNAEHEYFRLC